MTRLLPRILTRSFPANRNEPQSPGSADGAAEAQEAYESRAFGLWNERCRSRNAARVVLLGTLRGSALRFLSLLAADIGVVGLEPDSVGAGLDAFQGSGPYDAALAWDLPNYCNREELGVLGRWLHGKLAPGAPVFVSLATRSPYPGAPAIYDIVDEMHLQYRPTAAPEQRETFPTTQLTRAWPDFAIVRSFLLRNGMQEFLLEHSA